MWSKGPLPWGEQSGWRLGGQSTGCRQQSEGAAFAPLSCTTAQATPRQEALPAPHPGVPNGELSLALLILSAGSLTTASSHLVPALIFSSLVQEAASAFPCTLCLILFLPGANVTYALLGFPVNLCFQLAKLGY